MEPKIGDIVVVKKDIYIDFSLVSEGQYEVLGFMKRGHVRITQDDCEDTGEDDDEGIIESWREELVEIMLEGEDEVAWWIPFTKDICDFYKTPKRDKQLLLCF
jgi:hypothetical protein